MNFLEKRRRHRFVDRTIEETQNALQLPEVESRLGFLGSELVELQANLFVPNVRDGRIVLPKGIEDTPKIPIIAVAPGEKVTLPPVMQLPTPRQREVLRQHFDTLVNRDEETLSRQGIEKCIDHYYNRGDGFPLRPIDFMESGAVQMAARQHTMNESAFGGETVVRTFPGRPLVMLNIEPEGKRASYTHPTALSHEEVHLWQFNEAVPAGIVGKPQKAFFELMAYHSSAMVALGQLEKGGLSVGEPATAEKARDLIGLAGFTAIEVELQRAAHNDEANPFMPRPELMSYLEENNMMDLGR